LRAFNSLPLPSANGGHYFTFFVFFPSANPTIKNLNHFSVFPGLMRMIKEKKFSEKAFKKVKKA